MKKSFIISIMAAAIINANPYIGGKFGITRSKLSAELNNITNVSPGYFKANMNPIITSLAKNSVSIGIFGGYKFSLYHGFTPFVESDYEHKNSDIKSGRIDALSDLIVITTGQSQDHILRDEHIDIKGTHSFGFTAGTSVDIYDKFSALIGMRLNVSFYEVSAYHVLLNGTVNDINKQTKKMTVWGLEPIIGGAYRFSNNISARLTMGYNFQQSKQVVDNYIGNPTILALGVKAGVKISPSSFNLRASIIYTF